jgi:hypothetical protein
MKYKVGDKVTFDYAVVLIDELKHLYESKGYFVIRLVGERGYAFVGDEHVHRYNGSWFQTGPDDNFHLVGFLPKPKPFKLH